MSEPYASRSMKRQSAGALKLSLNEMLEGAGWCYLWTLTTPTVCTHAEISRMWRKFYKHVVYSKVFGMQMIKVYEEHPGGHGWHIHLITKQRIDVRDLRPAAEKAGFGRVNVKRVPSKRAHYVAKYVAKAFTDKGERLRRWACIGFQGTRTSETVVMDTLTREIGQTYRNALESALVEGEWQWTAAVKYFWQQQLKKSYEIVGNLLPCARDIVLRCEELFGVDDWSVAQLTPVSFKQGTLQFVAAPTPGECPF